VVIDNLATLCARHPAQLPAFLSSLLNPGTSLLAVYHLDIPLPSQRSRLVNEYAPDPLTLLTYLATAILKISSLAQTLDKKKARDRSVPEPDFGLAEDREGVLFSLSNSKVGHEEQAGVVIEMEVRRRSGRGVREAFVLLTHSKDTKITVASPTGRAGLVSKVCLLDDHPGYAPPDIGRGKGTEAGEEEKGESTFSLGLTEKQRKDREGIVLPYFDAQSGEGVGDGGRILYEMDRGDDFDEEEDEI
jgi:elongator complex protein 5